MKQILGAEPFFFNDKIKIIKGIEKIINSGQLSSGKFTKKFENRFSKYIGCKYSIAVNSGGTALQIALEALGIKNKDILLPTQTFIATANSIVRAGGRPIFCDIDRNTGCLDPKDVKKKITKKTAGIIFVPMFGILPKSILKIQKICKKKKIFLMEDAAHAHGASIKKIKAGCIGDISVFSFYATKILTTGGEGGVIVTNNQKLYEKSLILRNHGRNIKNQLFTTFGNNFRLSEIQSLIGYYQTLNLKKSLIHRNKIAKIYQKNLINKNFFENLKYDKNSLNSFWRYPLYLNNKIKRNELQKKLSDKYKIRITWMYEPLCHKQPLYSGKSKIKLPVAERAIKEIINLPTHPKVSFADANKICKYLILECEKLYNE
tara:strand:- start:680 stop:1804 length:1125 start_codon:yes stop_codon:yes gene_type:complete